MPRAAVCGSRGGSELTSSTPFLLLTPSDEFSFMLPLRARMVTFLVSIIAATFTSLLLTVIRLLICLHGATVSRKDVVSSTDFLAREDGVLPLLHGFRFPWRFGGTHF